MLIEAPETSPHFFLVGPRAPVGGTGPDAEEVATVVYKMRLSATGDVLDPGEVLLADEPFPGEDDTGPFRREAEIAVFKPEPDVVIVGNASQPGVAYGNIEIRRGGAPGPGVVVARVFDWIAKDSDGPLPTPIRLSLAGDNLDTFDAEAQRLPDNYRNAFQNGQPVAGQALFEQSDVIEFQPIVGPDRSLTIPPAPVFTITIGGAPPEPPVATDPKVDTIIHDATADDFTLIWRTVIPWEARLEAATLEIPDG